MNTQKQRTILIVGNKSTQQQSQESLKRITEYVSELMQDGAATCLSTFMDDIVYTIGDDFTAYDTRNDISLQDVDCVMIRGYGVVKNTRDAYYLSTFCEQNNVPCVLSYALYYPATKVAQAAIFRELGLPFLETLYSSNQQNLIQQAEAHFGYPYILKGSTGERGESNYLIRTANDAQVARAAEPDTDFIAQQFCPNDRDYRLLITGESHLIIERRGQADTHLNNTSQGGAATLTPAALSPEIVEQARLIAKRLRLQLAGIDVIQNLETKDYYFLEVNTQPQVQTGVFHDEKAREMKSLLLFLADQRQR